MQPTQPVQFHLPQDIVASLDEAVASGQYHTPSEIAYEVLTQWQLRRKILIEELRQLCEEGLSSGIAPDEPIEAILAEARRNFQAKQG